MAGRSSDGTSRSGVRCGGSLVRLGRIWAVAGLLLVALVGLPGEARAFHPFRHGFGAVGFGHCGVGPIGWGGWCGPRFGGYGCVPGWGFGGPGFGWGGCWPAFGSVSYGTGFAFGGTRFWSGSTMLGVPFWGGWAPVWSGCAPVWGGPVCGAPVFAGSFCGGPVFGGPVWGGPAWRSPISAWYGGWMVGPARGWNVGPAWGWNVPFAATAPAGLAPFGGGPRFAVPPTPAGWRPGPILLAGRRPAAGRDGRPAAIEIADVAAAPRGGRAAVGGAVIDDAVEKTIRTSNAPSRARAARLVKAGDRHLRAAVDDPTRLAKAIDAYRRAAAIAADQPDIFLRQAIALTAAAKRDAANAAVGRAVAIDRRLADADGAVAAVLPLAVPAGVTALDVRSGKLLERIFADRGDAGGEANWIARRWADRGGALALIAARP